MTGFIPEINFLKIELNGISCFSGDCESIGPWIRWNVCIAEPPPAGRFGLLHSAGRTFREASVLSSVVSHVFTSKPIGSSQNRPGVRGMSSNMRFLSGKNNVRVHLKLWNS